MFKLKLYVLEKEGQSKRIIESLHQLMNNYVDGEWSLDVVDILEHPELAEQEQIFAVPTLVRHLPEPVARLVGDLSDLDKVMVGLDILPIGSVPEHAGLNQNEDVSKHERR